MALDLMGIGINIEVKVNQAEKNIQSLTRSFNDMQKSTANTQRAISSAGKSFDNSRNSIHRFAVDMAASAFSMQQFGKNLFATGRNMTMAIAGIGGQAIKTGMEVQKFMLTLDALYGANQGKKVFQDLEKYALHSVFALEEMLPAVTMLKSAGIDAMTKVTAAGAKYGRTVLDYAADLGAMFPNIRNTYGTGIMGAMGAIKEFVAEGNKITLKRSVGLDIDHLLGLGEGATSKTSPEQRLQMIADLVQKIGAAGYSGNLYGMPMQQMSNLKDLMFNFWRRIADTGLYEDFQKEFAKIVSRLSDFVLNSKTCEKLIQSIGRTFRKAIPSISKFVDKVISGTVALTDFVTKNEDMVGKILKGATAFSVTTLAAGGFLTILSQIGYGTVALSQSYTFLIKQMPGFIQKLFHLRVGGVVTSSWVAWFGLLVAGFATNTLGVRDFIKELGKINFQGLLVNASAFFDGFKKGMQKALQGIDDFLSGLGMAGTGFGKSIAHFADVLADPNNTGIMKAMGELAGKLAAAAMALKAAAIALQAVNTLSVLTGIGQAGGLLGGGTLLGKGIGKLNGLKSSAKSIWWNRYKAEGKKFYTAEQMRRDTEYKNIIAPFYNDIIENQQIKLNKRSVELFQARKVLSDVQSGEHVTSIFKMGTSWVKRIGERETPLEVAKRGYAGRSSAYNGTIGSYKRWWSKEVANPSQVLSDTKVFNPSKIQKLAWGIQSFIDVLLEKTGIAKFGRFGNRVAMKGGYAIGNVLGKTSLGSAAGITGKLGARVGSKFLPIVGQILLVFDILRFGLNTMLKGTGIQKFVNSIGNLIDSLMKWVIIDNVCGAFATLWQVLKMVWTGLRIAIGFLGESIRFIDKHLFGGALAKVAAWLDGVSNSVGSSKFSLMGVANVLKGINKDLENNRRLANIEAKIKRGNYTGALTDYNKWFGGNYAYVNKQATKLGNDIMAKYYKQNTGKDFYAQSRKAQVDWYNSFNFKANGEAGAQRTQMLTDIYGGTFKMVANDMRYKIAALEKETGTTFASEQKVKMIAEATALAINKSMNDYGINKTPDWLNIIDGKIDLTGLAEIISSYGDIKMSADEIATVLKQIADSKKKEEEKKNTSVPDANAGLDLKSIGLGGVFNGWTDAFATGANQALNDVSNVGKVAIGVTNTTMGSLDTSTGLIATGAQAISDFSSALSGDPVGDVVTSASERIAKAIANSKINSSGPVTATGAIRFTQVPGTPFTVPMNPPATSPKRKDGRGGGLRSGGETRADGTAMLHKNEVIVNSPTTNRLKSFLAFEGKNRSGNIVFAEGSININTSNSNDASKLARELIPELKREMQKQAFARGSYS